VRLAVPLLIASLCALPARADDTTDACLAASNVGQDQRGDGKLTAARASFAKCAAVACPKLLRKQCSDWLTELDAAIPTVVFKAREGDGSDVADATVTEGGVEIAHASTGKAVPIDPGKHVFRFTSGARSTDVTVVVAEGEKLRQIVGTFPVTAPKTKDAPTPVETIRPTPALAYIGIAVFVAGAGSFAYFAATGKGIARSCDPRCSPDEVSDVRRRYLFADISAGVGLIGLGIATYSYVTRETVTRTAFVDVVPTASGIAATFAMAF
jgi:hypothetical protein